LKGHGFIRAVNDPYEAGFNPPGMFFEESHSTQ